MMEDTQVPVRSRMQSGRDQQGTQPARPYEFLELLVLDESGANITEKLEKLSNVTAPCRKDLEEPLQHLLSEPHEKTAIYLKQKFEEQKLWPFPRVDEKTTDPVGEKQRRSFRQPQPAPPRSKKKPKARAVDSEKWTLITPVPHLSCPCYPPRPPVPFLSEEERADAERTRTDLQYRISTLDFRVRRNLKLLLDLYLPGYERRAACPTVPGTPERRAASCCAPGQPPEGRAGLARAQEVNEHLRWRWPRRWRATSPSQPRPRPPLFAPSCPQSSRVLSPARR